MSGKGFLSLLQGTLGPKVLVVVLLRLLWLASELIVAGLFLLFLRPPEILPQSKMKV